jgi:hypothetical protein
MKLMKVVSTCSNMIFQESVATFHRFNGEFDWNKIDESDSTYPQLDSPRISRSGEISLPDNDEKSRINR